MDIWFEKVNVSDINRLLEKKPASRIGIEIVEIGNDFIKATLPVENDSCRTGGGDSAGSIMLAETLACTGANLCVNQEKEYCAELEVNASHVRQPETGIITGTGILGHRGKTIQVWDVRIIDQWDRLTCLSRVTMAVLPRA